MYFVNRTAAIEQLQSIHKNKFLRAQDNSGLEWVIPIADNVIGLGKSEFARHYIQKCRETWPNEHTRTPFQQTLCDCHTIFITFHKGLGPLM